MRDTNGELEACARCADSWAARRASLDAMHARLTAWCAWLAGGAILVSSLRILGAPWLA